MNKKCIALIILFCSGCRIGFEPTQWELRKIGKSIQTTSIYDYSQSRPSLAEPTEEYYRVDLITDIKGEKDSLTGFKVGFMHSIGDDNLKLNLGIDVRADAIGNDNDDYGFYGESAVSYNNTIAFTQVEPCAAVTLIPYIGLEKKIAEDFSINFNLGIPRTEWQAWSGYILNGYRKELQGDSWSGYGIRYSGGVSFETDSSNTKIVLSGFYESYKPEFLGEKAEIFGSGLFIGVEYRF